MELTKENIFQSIIDASKALDEVAERFWYYAYDSKLGKWRSCTEPDENGVVFFYGGGSGHSEITKTDT